MRGLPLRPPPTARPGRHRRGAATLVAVLVGGGSAIGTSIPAVAAVGRCGSAWVASWTAAPRTTARSLTGATLRQIVHLNTGGSAVRIRVTNLFGASPLRVERMTVALADAPGSGSFVPPPPSTTPPPVRSIRQVRFGGRAHAVVAAGAERWSDRLPLAVPRGSDLVVDLFLPGPTPALTRLASGRHVVSGWVAPGDRAGDPSAVGFGPPEGWSVVSGVDVAPATPMGLVVAFGDSLTEGYGSTPGANHRYPDFLADRLWVRRPVAVVNQGISANRLVPVPRFSEADAGPPGLSRFRRDVLGQSGVTDVLVVLGTNDVGIGTPPTEVIRGYKTLIAQARAAGIRIVGGTLPPSGDLSAGDPFGRGTAPTEAGRAVLNDWIRRSGAFDAVVDFDAAVRDPSSPNHWRVGLSSDGLHPHDFGYRVMANAVDPAVFRGRSC